MKITKQNILKILVMTSIIFISSLLILFFVKDLIEINYLFNFLINCIFFALSTGLILILIKQSTEGWILISVSVLALIQQFSIIIKKDFSIIMLSLIASILFLFVYIALESIKKRFSN